MPTIKDIAKAAGVSHGTVSNVLNKRGCVSYEKIRLVEETARAMGYAIDEKASTLRRGKAKTLAVVLPSIEEAQYTDLYTGILRHAEALGYTVRLFLTDDLPYLERRAVSDALALKVCGLLVVSCLGDEKEYAALLKRGIPLLFLERPPKTPFAPAYVFDMEQAACALCDLIAASRVPGESLCIVSGDAAYPDQQALTAALRTRLPIAQDAVYANVRGQLSPAVHEVMGRRPLPRGVVCASASIAGRVRAAHAQCGSDPMDVFALLPLRTTMTRDCHIVALNYRQMGHEAACSMLESIEQNRPLNARRFSPARTSPAFSAPAVVLKHPLRVLAHKTPSIEALRLLLPRFERQTGVPVELHARSMDDILRELCSAQADTWDVIRIDPSRLSYLGASLLRPLEEIDPQVDAVFAQMLPGLRREFSEIDGKVYTLPFDVSVQMLFYQKSLFENIGQIRAFYERTGKELRVPRTYAEFDEVSRFFSRAHRSDSPVPYGSTLALSRPMTQAAEYLPRLLSLGELRYTASGCPNLLTPQAFQALEDYFAFSRYVSPKAYSGWGEIAQDFINDHTATTVMFSNHSAHFIRNQSLSTNMEIGFATIPGGHPLLGGAALGVGRRCAQPQEAYAFLRFASGEEIAPELVMLGGSSPCSRVYDNREILDTYPWLAVLKENVALGARRTLLSDKTPAAVQAAFESTLSDQLLEAFSGRQTPRQALERTQEALEALAAK